MGGPGEFLCWHLQSLENSPNVGHPSITCVQACTHLTVMNLAPLGCMPCWSQNPAPNLGRQMCCWTIPEPSVCERLPLTQQIFLSVFSRESICCLDLEECVGVPQSKQRVSHRSLGGSALGSLGPGQMASASRQADIQGKRPEWQLKSPRLPSSLEWGPDLRALPFFIWSACKVRAVTCGVPESGMYLGKMLQSLMGQVHLDALTSWVWGNLVLGFLLFTGNPSFQPVSQSLLGVTGSSLVKWEDTGF